MQHISLSLSHVGEHLNGAVHINAITSLAHTSTGIWEPFHRSIVLSNALCMTRDFCVFFTNIVKAFVLNGKRKKGRKRETAFNEYEQFSIMVSIFSRGLTYRNRY